MKCSTPGITLGGRTAAATICRDFGAYMFAGVLSESSAPKLAVLLGNFSTQARRLLHLLRPAGVVVGMHLPTLSATGV